MPESTSLGRLLGLAGVAVWLGSSPSPAVAQVEKTRPGARAAAKPPAEDKGVPRISLLRLQVVKPDPGQPDGPPGFPRRNRFGSEAAPREGTSLTFTFDEPDQLILGLEAKDCKITRFRDDKDTDLAPDGKEPAAAGMIVAPRFGQEEGPLSATVPSPDPGRDQEGRLHRAGWRGDPHEGQRPREYWVDLHDELLTGEESREPAPSGSPCPRPSRQCIWPSRSTRASVSLPSRADESSRLPSRGEHRPVQRQNNFGLRLRVAQSLMTRHGNRPKSRALRVTRVSPRLSAIDLGRGFKSDLLF